MYAQAHTEHTRAHTEHMLRNTPLSSLAMGPSSSEELPLPPSLSVTRSLRLALPPSPSPSPSWWLCIFLLSIKEK